MFNTYVDYPSDEELAEIVLQTTGQGTATVEPVLDRVDIEQIQGLVRRVPIARPVIDYVVRLSAVTRPVHPQSPAFIKDYVELGLWSASGRSTWPSAPRPTRCCTASRTLRSKASGPSPAVCCGIASP